MGIFADFSNIRTVIALVIAAFGVFLLFISPKIAKKRMENKHPDLKEGDEQYEQKHLDITIKYKIAAAVITVAACVFSLL